MTALLIAKGADVNMNTKSGHSPLFRVLLRYNTQEAELLISQAELLISHGADVNAKVSLWYWKGFTPLHLACMIWDKAIVELLLATGADINAKTDKGDTPLSLAKENKHTGIVELLRRHGAKE
jgi:ankyrin repeat protein